jgi:magnesium-transporting ATPase (P-type)
MFTFKKQPRIKTILINSSRILIGSEMTVDGIWQSPAAEDMMIIISKAINESVDPLDAALHRYLQTQSVLSPPHLPLYDTGFDRDDGVSSTIWHYGADYQVVVKGMPEHILEKCDLSENEREALMIRMHTMSAFGAHIVALATITVKHPVKNLGDLRITEKLTFVGFISLHRNVSDEARQLVATATHRGIAMYMTTGQHPTAAYGLARRLGLVSQLFQVVDARTLDVSAGKDRSALLKTARVFARADIKHKQHVAETLIEADPTTRTVNSLDELKKLLAKHHRTML